MLNWSAIVGSRGADTAGVLHSVLTHLRQVGVQPCGFYQERVLDDAGEIAGWDVVRIGQPGRVALARRSPDPDLCDYGFDPDAFATAASWASAPGADLAVVGGLGKLEAAGSGHWPLVQCLLERSGDASALFCIRDTSLTSLALRMPDPAAFVHLPCDERVLSQFHADMKRLVAHV